MSVARFDAVLFDLDGTLADTIELILTCYRHTMRTHLGCELDDALWLEGLGTPIERQLATFARSPDEALLMRETYRSFQLTIHDRMVRAYPGIPELLDDLARHGIATAVVTSKARPIAERTLAVCGLGARFDTLITPEDVRNGKPDPEPILAALVALGVADPARALMVGDAPADLLAGRAAGVHTAAALWGPFSEAALRRHEPDWLVPTAPDLLPIVAPRAADDA